MYSYIAINIAGINLYDFIVLYFTVYVVAIYAYLVCIH